MIQKVNRVVLYHPFEIVWSFSSNRYLLQMQRNISELFRYDARLGFQEFHFM